MMNKYSSSIKYVLAISSYHSISSLIVLIIILALIYLIIIDLHNSILLILTMLEQYITFYKFFSYLGIACNCVKSFACLKYSS